jgi:hypothetical protein
MPLAQENTGSQSHSNDLILEVILCSLPATSAKLSKEQSIDFGTVIESLKTMFKGREKVRVELSPMSGDASADVLFKTWEAYASATNKDFNSDRVLLSCSHEIFVDIAKKISAHGQQIMTL